MERCHRHLPLPSRSLTANAAPWLYAITDGTATNVLTQVRTAAEAGVNAIQIREPLLSARQIFEICVQARSVIAPHPCLLLLNQRWDIALASSLDGVHLPSSYPPSSSVRAHVPPGFLIAASCHSLPELQAATGHVDFCVLGPIFRTPSKDQYGPPLGLEALRSIQSPSPPVLAIGGITSKNALACLAAGAAGLAGIRLFAPSRAFATVATILGTGPGKSA